MVIFKYTDNEETLVGKYETWDVGRAMVMFVESMMESGNDITNPNVLGQEHPDSTKYVFTMKVNGVEEKYFVLLPYPEYYY